MARPQASSAQGQEPGSSLVSHCTKQLSWGLASSLCILGKSWTDLELCTAMICWLGCQIAKRTKMSRGRNDVSEGASEDPLERTVVEKRFTSVQKSCIKCLLCPYFNLFCKRLHRSQQPVEVLCPPSIQHNSFFHFSWLCVVAVGNSWPLL